METLASEWSEVIISYKSQPLSDFRLRPTTSGQDHLAYNPVWMDIWHSRLREQHRQHSFPHLKSISMLIFDHQSFLGGLIAWVPWSALSRANRYQISVCIPQGTKSIRCPPLPPSVTVGICTKHPVTVKNRGEGDGGNSGQVLDQSLVRKLTSSPPHSA